MQIYLTRHYQPIIILLVVQKILYINYNYTIYLTTCQVAI